MTDSVFCLYDPWPTTIPQTRPTTGSDGIFSLVNDHFEYSVFPRIAAGALTSVPNGGLLQCWAQTPLTLFNCFELSFIVATPQRHSQINVRCIVTMLPAHRRSDTFVVIQVFWTRRIGEQLLSTAMQHNVLCKCYENSLSNNDKDLYFVRLL